VKAWSDMISLRRIEGIESVLHEATPSFERQNYHPGNQLIKKSLLASRIVVQVGG